MASPGVGDGPRHPCGFYDYPNGEAAKVPRREWTKTPTVELEAPNEDEWPPDNEIRLEAHDPIERPQHYTAGKVECIEAIEAAAEGWPSWIAPHLANAMKYEWRAFKKGKALRDLRKARWYLDRAMAALLLHGYTEVDE